MAHMLDSLVAEPEKLLNAKSLFFHGLCCVTDYSGSGQAERVLHRLAELLGFDGDDFIFPFRAADILPHCRRPAD